MIAETESKKRLLNLKGEYLSGLCETIQIDLNHDGDLVFPVIANNDKKAVMVQRNGVVPIPKANEIKRINVRYLAYRVKNKWGVLNATGTVMFRPQFDAIEKFEKGKFLVTKNGEMIQVNKKGE